MMTYPGFQFVFFGLVLSLKSQSFAEQPSLSEEHYALNWLIGYMDQAWDDISTDT